MVDLNLLTTKDVQDYIDERASPEVVQAVEDLMEQDWQVAQLVAAYREQAANMHRAFGRDADRVPHRLRAIVSKTVRAGG